MEENREPAARRIWIRADQVVAGDEIVGPSDDPLRRDCGVVEDPNQTCKYPSDNQRLIGFVGGRSGIAVEPSRMLEVVRAREGTESHE